MAICHNVVICSFSMAQGAGVGEALARVWRLRPAVQWQSLEDFTCVGFRAAERMTDISST